MNEHVHRARFDGDSPPDLIDDSERTMCRKNYVLAELRCAHARLRLAQCDVESVTIALEHSIISPEQAVAMLWGSDACDYFAPAAAP